MTWWGSGVFLIVFFSFPELACGGVVVVPGRVNLNRGCLLECDTVPKDLAAQALVLESDGVLVRLDSPSEVATQNSTISSPNSESSSV